MGEKHYQPGTQLWRESADVTNLFSLCSGRSFFFVTMKYRILIKEQIKNQKRKKKFLTLLFLKILISKLCLQYFCRLPRSWSTSITVGVIFSGEAKKNRSLVPFFTYLAIGLSMLLSITQFFFSLYSLVVFKLVPPSPHPKTVRMLVLECH